MIGENEQGKGGRIMDSSKLSRRGFLKTTAAAASLAGLAGCGLLPKKVAVAPKPAGEKAAVAPKPVGEQRKLNIACVGVNGKGDSDMRGVAASENIVGLCDVDEKQAAEARKDFPNARFFQDFRKMIDELGDGIDAVTVSTPDHMHYPAASYAIEHGKHVYVQKPLTHSVWEARQLLLLSRKHNVATQMGNQGHSADSTRLIVEWIRAGIIGTVHEVHFWTNRPIWPQGITRPTGASPCPPELDWNLWLGVAPLRPYHEDADHRGTYHPFKWRGWWDFGCGALGDMACHIMDAAFWALELGGRSFSVQAESSPVNTETAPVWSIVTYDFPSESGLPPVKLVWYDGGKKPPRPEELPERDAQWRDECGQIYIGDKGKLIAGTYGESPSLLPKSKMGEFLKNRPPKTIPRSPGHYEEWILACKGGKPSPGSFEFAVPFTEAVLVGNIAIRTGAKFQWDAKNMRSTDSPQANELVRRQYRKF